MKNYRVEMMTKEDYHLYRMGHYIYHIEEVDIEADSKEQAVSIVKANNPTMVVIHENHVRTVEEIEKERAEERARMEATRVADELRRERAKARKEERERKAAEAVGMTVEEYRADQKRLKKIKTLENEIQTLKALLTEKESKLESLKK